MSIVSWMVNTTEDFLDAAAESQFGAVASGIGAIVTTASVLLVVLVLINMVLQVRSMDARTAIFLLIRLVLISIFAFNWAQFNLVSNAVIDGLNRVGGALVSSVGGTGGSFSTFATAFDDIIEEFANYLNAAGQNMSWMAGSILGIAGAAALGLLGALCGGLLIFARIMITFMLGIAPLMIAASMFDVTKDFFQRWLSATISYALYPVVIAGVFSTIVGMTQGMLSTLGDPSAAANIGALVPFFAMILLSKGLIAATPFLVRGLSGNLSFASARAYNVATGAISARRMGQAAANGATYQNRVRMGTATDSEQIARAAVVVPRTVASTAGSAIRNIQARSQRLGK